MKLIAFFLFLARKLKYFEMLKIGENWNFLIFGAKIQIFYELNNLKLDQINKITRFARKN